MAVALLCLAAGAALVMLLINLSPWNGVRAI
jgi:hypothetical protein